MKNEVGEIRPGQLITTFGPGAIVDSINDSLIILDLKYWDKAIEKIYDKRLANFLKRSYFKKIPTLNKHDLPAVPFPFYHVCSNNKCRNLFDIRDNFNIGEYLEKGPLCPLCKFKAHPSRFIITCEGNHLDDFPWRWWAHGRPEGKIECNGKLTLTSTGKSSGLDSLYVKCECGLGNNLSKAMKKASFANFKCTGNHPHSMIKNNKCDKHVVPLQRGASNVYFPALRSSISFPENTGKNGLDNEKLFLEYKDRIENYIKDNGLNKLKENYKLLFGANIFEDGEDFINKWLEFKRLNSEVNSYKQIKEIEYERFTNFEGKIKFENFEAESQVLPEDLILFFKKIIQVHKLKEILVLLGFMRGESPEPEVEEPKDIVWLNSKPNENWLPAVEVHGEGIFIELNREMVNEWLEKVQNKSIIFQNLYKKWVKQKGWTLLEDRNALYVLLHTLSHLLIKQLSLESGYSSVAIKERIYCSDDMAGILLYTGSTDQEGSLGGLVEMGNVNKFRKILLDGLEEAMFCSNDPVCSILEVNEENNLNGSACYACSMISETSCEFGNKLLDRSLVVSLIGNDTVPFFERLV